MMRKMICAILMFAGVICAILVSMHYNDKQDMEVTKVQTVGVNIQDGEKSQNDKTANSNGQHLSRIEGNVLEVNDEKMYVKIRNQDAKKEYILECSGLEKPSGLLEEQIYFK
ncbi:MAG: hypothetical protein PHQ72_00165 [Hespellia sp.]|nr:hypothetical protein [Hespellia sp.]